MSVTITLSHPEVAALRHVLDKCLGMARRSPVMSDALDINPDDEAYARQALDKLPPIIRQEYVRKGTPATDNK